MRSEETFSKFKVFSLALLFMKEATAVGRQGDALGKQTSAQLQSALAAKDEALRSATAAAKVWCNCCFREFSCAQDVNYMKLSRLCPALLETVQISIIS